MREGAHDYIPKPVPLPVLIFRVEKALSSRTFFLENKADRQQLEHMVSELKLRLGQNKAVLTALTTLVQSIMTQKQRTSESYVRLESALAAFGDGGYR